MEYRDIFTQDSAQTQNSQAMENMTFFPPLQIEEEAEQELLIKTKAGDLSARRELIYGKMYLVFSIVQRFSDQEKSDLFQVGCNGLVKAVDNFNIEFDVKFSTYAVPMIIGEIRRYLRDNNSIRISRSIRDTAYKALGAREELMREKECEPTVDELAQELGEEREAVIRSLEAIATTEPYKQLDLDAAQLPDDYEHLQHVIKDLSAREQEIIHMRYHQNKTQQEVADLLGISQSYVSKLEKRALTYLRKQM